MKRIKTDDPDIFLADNGFYYYRGTPPGEPSQIERSLKTDDFGKARKEKRRLLEDIQSTGVAAKKRIFKPLAERYLKERFEKVGPLPSDLRPRTYESDAYITNNFLIPYFGKFKLDAITPYAFDRFCIHFGHRTYFNHRKTLVGILNWCKSQKLVKEVPAFELPDWKERQRVALTTDEICAILNNSHGNLLLYTAMYLLNGMRNSEIVMLTWDRVDLDNQSITLREIDTKTKKPRQIPINTLVYQILKNRKRLGPYVFPNKKASKRHTHMSLQGFNNPWSKLLERSKISRHITPHDLRATFETYSNKNPLFTDTQREKMVGAKIDVQKSRYVQFTADDLRGLENSVQFENFDTLLQQLAARGNLGETPNEV